MELENIVSFKAVNANGEETVITVDEMTELVADKINARSTEISTFAATSSAGNDKFEDQLPVMTNANWVRGLDANGNPIRVLMNDLAKVVGGLLDIDGIRLDFDGNFSNFLQWNKPGAYRYNINTADSGTIDGPEGTSPVYGTLEILIRDRANLTGLNVIYQKFYSHNGYMKMRICTKRSGDPVGTWSKGEWKTIY